MNDTQLIWSILAAVTLIFSGTVAGYITNKYAVRWLFKPVRLFGKQLFDVSILSTDDKQQAFIDSLSDCVETRILTDDVLKKEIMNDTMRQHVEEIVDHFLSQDLPESFQQVRLTDLPGFPETEERFRDYGDRILEENAGALLHHILSEIRVADYLNEAQIRNATDQLYDVLKDALKNHYALHDKYKRVRRELLVTAMFHSEGRAALGHLTSRWFRSQEEPSPMDDMTPIPDKLDQTLKTAISDGVSSRIHEKSLADYLSAEQEQQLTDMVVRELKRQYDLHADRLYQENVNTWIASLGRSRRLRKNAADVLYDYVVRNIHKLLHGKVKSTVSMALGRLDPEQLCDVAEMLLKGELKYLSYFGAVLGFLISIPALFLTLGGFHPTGFPQSPWMFLFLVALMAFIGVITNVIAIRMFFRPYRPIRALAKSPRLKVFSQGLILQNQQRFAEMLGDYIGTNLLTEDNITRMLRANQDLFIDVIRRSALAYVREYFQSESNRSKIASKLSALIFNQLAEKAGTLSERIVRYAGERDLGSYIDLNKVETSEKAKNLYYSVLDKLTEPGLIPAEDMSENRYLASTVASLVKGSPKLMENVWDLLESFYVMRLSDTPVCDYVSLHLLSRSVEHTLTGIVQNDAAFHSFRGALNDCVDGLTKQVGAVFAEEFLEAAAERTAGAAYEAAMKGLPGLLQDIHFAEVTREKVAGLPPEEIEGIVRSFADPVFRKLYALGSIGAVFGVNTYLAFVLLIVDKIRD